MESEPGIDSSQVIVVQGCVAEPSAGDISISERGGCKNSSVQFCEESGTEHSFTRENLQLIGNGFSQSDMTVQRSVIVGSNQPNVHRKVTLFETIEEDDSNHSEGSVDKGKGENLLPSNPANKVSPTIDDEPSHDDDQEPLLTVDDTESLSSDIISLDTVSYDIIHVDVAEEDDEKSIGTTSTTSYDLKMDSPQRCPGSRASNSSMTANLLDNSNVDSSAADALSPSPQIIVTADDSSASSCASTPSSLSAKTVSTAVEDSLSEAVIDILKASFDSKSDSQLAREVVRRSTSCCSVGNEDHSDELICFSPAENIVGLGNLDELNSSTIHYSLGGGNIVLRESVVMGTEGDGLSPDKKLNVDNVGSQTTLPCQIAEAGTTSFDSHPFPAPVEVPIPTWNAVNPIQTTQPSLPNVEVNPNITLGGGDSNPSACMTCDDQADYMNKQFTNPPPSSEVQANMCEHSVQTACATLSTESAKEDPLPTSSDEERSCLFEFSEATAAEENVTSLIDNGSSGNDSIIQPSVIKNQQIAEVDYALCKETSANLDEIINQSIAGEVAALIVTEILDTGSAKIISAQGNLDVTDKGQPSKSSDNDTVEEVERQGKNNSVGGELPVKEAAALVNEILEEAMLKASLRGSELSALDHRSDMPHHDWGAGEPILELPLLTAEEACKSLASSDKRDAKTIADSAVDSYQDSACVLGTALIDEVLGQGRVEVRMRHTGSSSPSSNAQEIVCKKSLENISQLAAGDADIAKPSSPSLAEVPKSGGLHDKIGANTVNSAGVKHCSTFSDGASAHMSVNALVDEVVDHTMLNFSMQGIESSPPIYNVDETACGKSSENTALLLSTDLEKPSLPFLKEEEPDSRVMGDRIVASTVINSTVERYCNPCSDDTSAYVLASTFVDEVIDRAVFQVGMLSAESSSPIHNVDEVSMISTESSSPIHNVDEVSMLSTESPSPVYNVDEVSMLSTESPSPIHNVDETVCERILENIVLSADMDEGKPPSSTVAEEVVLELSDKSSMNDVSTFTDPIVEENCGMCMEHVQETSITAVVSAKQNVNEDSSISESSGIELTRGQTSEQDNQREDDMTSKSISPEDGTTPDSTRSSRSSLHTAADTVTPQEASASVEQIVDQVLPLVENQKSTQERSPVKIHPCDFDGSFPQVDEDELATPCGDLLTEHFMDFESGRNVSVFRSVPDESDMTMSAEHLSAYDRVVSTIGTCEVDFDTGKSVSVFRSEDEVFYEIQRASTCTSVFESVEEEDEDMIDTVLSLEDRRKEEGINASGKDSDISSKERSYDRADRDCDAFEDAVDAFLEKELKNVSTNSEIDEKTDNTGVVSDGLRKRKTADDEGSEKIPFPEVGKKATHEIVPYSTYRHPDCELSDSDEKRRMAERWANGGELEVPDTPDMREKQRAIQEALNSGTDVASKLCKLALTEGGLINDSLRREAWPRMLGLDPTIDIPAPPLDELKSHPEYCQVVLDVNRSLKRFPPDIPQDQRETLQDKLTRLIMYVITKYPHLRYYQGYHDVAVTFLLVVGEAIAFQIMERLSTEHLSDCMQPTMERTSYLLHFIYPLLHRLHPTLADYLERSEVGTMFCLPWFLTWFGHSLNRYQDVVRLYDHFLASPPLSPLYLAAVLVAHRADEVLAVDCDMAAIHALLSHIPDTLPLEILLRDATDLYERYPPESIEKEVEQRFTKEQEMRMHEMEARERVRHQRALRRRHGSNRDSGSWQVMEFQNRFAPAVMALNQWMPPWVVQQQRLSMRLLFASATFFVGFYVYARGGDVFP